LFILLRHYFYFVAVLWLSYVCFKFLLSLFIYNRFLVLLYTSIVNTSTSHFLYLLFCRIIDFPIKSISLHTWWNVVKLMPCLYFPVSSIIAVMSGEQPKFFQCNFKSNVCLLCDKRSNDNALHILFECEALDAVRKYHILYISFVMPYGMKQEFRCMSDERKLLFMLSCFNCGLCPEWIGIYKSIAKFVHDMYKRRKCLFDRIL